MHAKPLISVVMPVYNSGKWVAEVIGDVLAQTHDHLELIVVDDGSKDNTGDVVKGIADPRIQYFAQPNSGSPSRPRNIGLSHAKGEWISFLDSDDRWQPTRLHRLLELFRADPSLHGVFNDQWIVTNGQRTGVLRCEPPEHSFYVDLLLGRNRIGPSGWMIRTECARALNGFSEERKEYSVEDYEFLVRFGRAGYRTAFVQECLGDYTIHADNFGLCSKKSKGFLGITYCGRQSNPPRNERRSFHHEALRRIALEHLAAEPALLEPHRHAILAYCDLSYARSLHADGNIAAARAKYRDAWSNGLRSSKLLIGWTLSTLGLQR